MSNQVPNVNTVKSGLCPHGMSPGACPVCSGMGGSGMRPGERIQKPGEMSYHQCAIIGAMMKARAESLKVHEANLKLQAENVQLFEKNMEKIAKNISQFAAMLTNSKIPVLNIPLKVIGFVINMTTVPILNLVKNIPTFIQKNFDIQDKLNAMFGEAKAFLDKKTSEFVSILKLKFDNIFKIFKKNNSDDEDTKIDDDKKIFNLKTMLHKIKSKLKKNDREIKSKS